MNQLSKFYRRKQKEKACQNFPKKFFKNRVSVIAGPVFAYRKLCENMLECSNEERIIARDVYWGIKL